MENKIGYAKPPEPKFIREMKAKLGYREPADNLEDKLRGDAGDFDDREDREDEAPTVVVMKDGDLTQEDSNEEPTVKKEKKHDTKKNDSKKSKQNNCLLSF